MPQSKSNFGYWMLAVVQDTVFLVLGAVFYTHTEHEACPGPIRPLVLGCFIVNGIKLFLNIVVACTTAEGPAMVWAIAVLVGQVATYAETAIYTALGWMVWWGDYGTSSECHHTSSTIWIWARVAGMFGLLSFFGLILLLVRACVKGRLDDVVALPAPNVPAPDAHAPPAAEPV